MIKTAEPRKGNHNQVSYEEAFASKFELVKVLPNFESLERFAQQCIDLHCGDSLNGILARVYMDKVIEMTDDEFIVWATQYTKNIKS